MISETSNKTEPPVRESASGGGEKGTLRLCRSWLRARRRQPENAHAVASNNKTNIFILRAGRLPGAKPEDLPLAQFLSI